MRAAFVRYAAEDAIMFDDGQPVQGKEAVGQIFADWPATARLEWAGGGPGVRARRYGLDLGPRHLYRAERYAQRNQLRHHMETQNGTANTASRLMHPLAAAIERSLDAAPRTRLYERVDAATFHNEIKPRGKPAILKGLSPIGRLLSPRSNRRAHWLIICGRMQTGRRLNPISARRKSPAGFLMARDYKSFNFQKRAMPLGAFAR